MRYQTHRNITGYPTIVTSCLPSYCLPTCIVAIVRVVVSTKLHRNCCFQLKLGREVPRPAAVHDTVWLLHQWLTVYTSDLQTLRRPINVQHRSLQRCCCPCSCRAPRHNASSTHFHFRQTADPDWQKPRTVCTQPRDRRNYYVAAIIMDPDIILET